MTNEQILKLVIKKAMKNGFNYRYNTKRITYDNLVESIFIDIQQFSDAYKSIIFSHDFAKYFWGEEDKIVITTEKGISGYTPRFEYPAWKEHLRKMVLEENPLKYLEKFL